MVINNDKKNKSIHIFSINNIFEITITNKVNRFPSYVKNVIRKERMRKKDNYNYTAHIMLILT